MNIYLLPSCVLTMLATSIDLHMAQLMPLPLTVSCFSKIQTGFTFVVLAHPGSSGKRAAKPVCVHMCVYRLILIPLGINTINISRPTLGSGIVCSLVEVLSAGFLVI